MPERIAWTRDQQLIALRLYVGTAFGRLDGRNPEIVALAGRIGRSANALAMKACNFASLDQAIRQTGWVGLAGASSADPALVGRVRGRYGWRQSPHLGWRLFRLARLFRRVRLGRLAFAPAEARAEDCPERRVGSGREARPAAHRSVSRGIAWYRTVSLARDRSRRAP